MSDNKLDKIVEVIKSGTFTRDEVIAAAGCTTKAFASYLTSLRNAAKYSGAPICPIEKDVDGKKVLVAGLYTEYEATKAISADSSTPAVEKPLADQHAAAVKNLNKANAALARFQARKDNGEKFEKGSLDDLKFQVAKLNVQIATKVYEVLPALPVEDESPVEPVAPVDTENDELL